MMIGPAANGPVTSREGRSPIGGADSGPVTSRAGRSLIGGADRGGARPVSR